MALFAGCANQDVMNTAQSQDDQVALIAEKSTVKQGDVIDEFGVSLRTSIDLSTSPAHTYWSVGDKFKLQEINNTDFNGNNGGFFEFVYKTSTNIENVAAGTFTKVTGGNISDGSYVCVYPYIKAMLVTAAGTQGNGDIHLDLYGQNQNGSGAYNNFGGNAFMYSNLFSLKKGTANSYLIDATAVGQDISKVQSGIYFNHATAFLVLNFTNIPAGTVLYQIEVKAPVDASGNDVLKRTTAIPPSGLPVYVNPTPSIKLFADADANGTNGYKVDNTGTYKCGIVINPGLSAGSYLRIYLRTSLGDAGFKLTYPKGIERSCFYPITVSWNQLIIHNALDPWGAWDGVSYSIPHIAGNNIIIRTASELRWLAGVCNDITMGYVPNYDFGALSAENNAKGFDFTGCTITLASDIDLSGQTWRAIGLDNNYKFNGTFIGGNHKITNFVLEQASGKISASKGIFNYIGGSVTGLKTYDNTGKLIETY